MERQKLLKGLFMKQKAIEITSRFSRMKINDGHASESRNFIKIRGVVVSVACLKQDERWQITLKPLYRKGVTLFTCPLADISDEQTQELKNRAVVITKRIISTT